MSSDNGIYLLVSPTEDGCSEYRVIHTQGIDNLYWDDDAGDYRDDIQPAALLSYFKKSQILTKEKAYAKAFEMEEEVMNDDFCPVLEYGISTITLDKPFSWYEKQAKVKL